MIRQAIPDKLPSAKFIKIYASLIIQFLRGYAARCAERLCLSGRSSTDFEAVPQHRMRHSLKDFDKTINGEAQPSPHIRRHSRKRQIFQLV